MRVLAVTGGHSFDRDAFASFLDALPHDVTWTEHPDALGEYAPTDFDAVLHYDMPGTLPHTAPPPASFIESIECAKAEGVGFVVLHHAIAAWPEWAGWSELVGGKYLYQPGSVRGAHCPDSGYRHGVRQRFSFPTNHHPVAAGLPATFELVDETYLCQVFEDDVTPLLITDADMSDSVHFSTALAMSGRRDERDGWTHSHGSQLAGWTRTVGASRLVYLQPGDTATTLADPHYRSLVSNALAWATHSS